MFNADTATINNVSKLLQAAEYLERREREAEHGYASLYPHVKSEGGRRKMSHVNSGYPRKTPASRSTHNELEKNRRAHLRTCLDNLKSIVPLGPETSRHTTLGLLTKAKSFIKLLEDKEKKNHSMKSRLVLENTSLQSKLHGLRRQIVNVRKNSEGQYSTDDSEDVDVMSFGSANNLNSSSNNSRLSDNDDRSSMGSGCSDGVSVNSIRIYPAFMASS